MSTEKKKRTGIPKPSSFVPFNFYNILIAALGIVMLLVFFIYSYMKGITTGVTLSLLLFVAYVCVLSIIGIFCYLHERRNYRTKLGNKRTSKTEDFPLGTLSDLSQPIALCDEDGEIVWMNRSFSTHSEYGILLNEDIRITSLFDFDEAVIVDAEEGESDEVSDTPRREDVQITEENITEVMNVLSSGNYSLNVNGKLQFGGNWKMHVYPHHSSGVQYFLVVLTDRSRLLRLSSTYTNSLIHVIYIAIDNLSEIAQTDQSQYRIASTQIDAVIKTWAEKNNAFIKEYEREKYFIVMNHMDFLAEEARRFDILEKVSLARIGKEDLPVTVSIGVSSENGTLAEKEREAQAAFDMALQRGGNQAVVLGETVRFYGAKTLTSQKRSGVRHRVFAEKLLYHINESANVVIMAHRNADFDALGACVGLARLATSKGKNTRIIANLNDQSLKECYDRLRRSDSEYYRDMFINATEGQNLVARADSLLICTDVNNPDNVESRDVINNANRVFIIDHHRQNTKTPETQYNVKGEPVYLVETLIVPSASSASELVSEIIQMSGINVRLNHTEAEIMYAGMILDTKNFTRNTQVSTFEAAIFLRENGADPTKSQTLFKTEFEDFKQEGSFSTDLEIFNQFIVIAKELSTDSTPSKRIMAAKTADRLLNIKDIRASFVVTKMMNDVFISARSDGSVNVQLIMEALKGGGHYNAAATMLKDISVESAIEQLKNAVSLYFGFENPAKLKKR